MFLIVFWSPKQSKLKERSMESMAKKMESHLHKEFKLWSPVVLCQKQIKNARMKATWRMQEDINCLTLLKNFPESIWCMLYVVLKLGKSSVQRFKRCMNRSWNEPLAAKSQQVEGQFHSAAKSAFGCEMISQPSCTSTKFRSPRVCLRNGPECFQIFATDSFGYFSPDIWCLNPHFLLVTHQL